MAGYEKSLEYQAFDDIDKFVKFFEKELRGSFTHDNVGVTLSYNIDDMLRDSDMKNFKKKIYKKIMENFTNFYKAYLEVHIKGNGEDFSVLRGDKETPLKIAIRQCFLKNGLPFTKWEEIEGLFLQQKYDTIDEADLNPSGKH